MPAPGLAQPSGSALTLLVPRLAADDAHGAIATNDLAVTAHFLHGSSNFHRSISKVGSRREPTPQPAARQVAGGAPQRIMPPLP